MCDYCDFLIGYWFGVATAMFSWLFLLFASVADWSVLITALLGTLFTFLLLYIGVRKTQPHYYAYPKTYKKAKTTIRFFGGFIGALTIVIWLFISVDFFK